MILCRRSGAREIVRASRHSEPDDLLDSEHMDMLKQNSRSDLEQLQSRTFPTWFKLKMEELRHEGSIEATNDMYSSMFVASENDIDDVMLVRNDVEPMNCDEDEFMNDDDEDKESEDVEPTYESEDKEASEEDEDDGIQVVRQSITSEAVGDRGKEVVGDRGLFTPNVLVSHQLLIIDPALTSSLTHRGQVQIAMARLCMIDVKFVLSIVIWKLSKGRFASVVLSQKFNILNKELIRYAQIILNMKTSEQGQTFTVPSLLLEINTLWFNFTEANERMESRWQPPASAVDFATVATLLLEMNFDVDLSSKIVVDVIDFQMGRSFKNHRATLKEHFLKCHGNEDVEKLRE
ncbi:hypothetical protein L6452_30184 [Arctium lappa]|uniref:Uncharacterized protein n=1 Tax=Arctium lappa TaxID=4217 RepID=A0ACB8ZJ03_ARCLA|nr:hypothetical protein L6452_30184 [Arctium lappa]